MILYSPATCLFYDSEISREIPDGSVEITSEEHQRLLDGQTAGMVISAGPNGRPKLTKRPPLTEQEIVAMSSAIRDNLLSLAAVRIAPLQDAVDLDVATQEEADQLSKWKQYRVAVNRVDLTQLSPVWPDLPA